MTLDVRVMFKDRDFVRLDKEQRKGAGWKGSFYVFGHTKLPAVIVGINRTGRYALVYKSDLDHAAALCKEGREQRRAHKKPQEGAPLKPTEAYFFVFEGEEGERRVLGNALPLEVLQRRIEACPAARVSNTSSGDAYLFDDNWRIVIDDLAGQQAPLPLDFKPAAKVKSLIDF